MILKLPWIAVREGVLREIRTNGSYDMRSHRFEFWGGGATERTNGFFRARSLPYRLRSNNFVVRLVKVDQ